MARKRHYYRDELGRFAPRYYRDELGRFAPRPKRRYYRDELGRFTPRPEPVYHETVVQLKVPPERRLVRGYIKPSLRPKKLTAHQREKLIGGLLSLDLRDPWERHLARDRPPGVAAYELAKSAVIERGIYPDDPGWKSALTKQIKIERRKLAAALYGLSTRQLTKIIKSGLLGPSVIEQLLDTSPK